MFVVIYKTYNIHTRKCKPLASLDAFPVSNMAKGHQIEPHLKTSVLDLFEITKNFVLFIARFDHKIISELPGWYIC